MTLSYNDRNLLTGITYGVTGEPNLMLREALFVALLSGALLLETWELFPRGSMLIVASTFLLVAPAIVLLAYIALPLRSRWRGTLLALFIYFVALLNLWAGFLLWVRIKTQLALTELFNHGLKASDFDLRPFQDGLVLRMLDRPWFFVGYVGALLSVTYWSWHRARKTKVR